MCLVLGGLLGAAGCGQNDATADLPETPLVQTASPGGAPSYGEQTGTGFSTGDAFHSGGQGSGLSGYHQTGAAGTSAAISDTHPLGPPPEDAKDPVLPPA